MAFDGADAAGLKVRFLARLDVVGNVTVVAREGLNPNTADGWARKAGRRSEQTGIRRSEYARLRALGVPRRRAAEQIGVNERTAKDWDYGVRKNREIGYDGNVGPQS